MHITVQILMNSTVRITLNLPRIDTHVHKNLHAYVNICLSIYICMQEWKYLFGIHMFKQCSPQLVTCLQNVRVALSSHSYPTQNSHKTYPSQLHCINTNWVPKQPPLMRFPGVHNRGRCNPPPLIHMKGRREPWTLGLELVILEPNCSFLYSTEAADM